MKNICLMALVFMFSQTIFGNAPQANPTVNHVKDNAVSTGGLVGAGFFLHNVATEFRYADTKGYPKYLAVGKWSVPAAICLAVAASKPLKIKCETESNSFYKYLLPVPAAGTGYFLSRMLQSSPSGSAKLLCATYAVLTGLCLHEICQ